MKLNFLLLTLVISLFSINSSWALDSGSVNSAGFGKLTEEQKADILKTIAATVNKK
ncbi:MAG: hypothetical protein ACD_33C00002G0033 [uncultured bacterium]|nr:MAG: hypothetical protein ACD_33C00002G0033 [uncultured bacterium]